MIDSPATATAGSLVNIEEKPKLDRVLDRASEWCSSLLVKETRQALKSRQFLATFFVLLIAVGAWSILAITFVLSESGINATPGTFLLFGYWVILGFPLAIIIPFASYRSLANEFEDGTLQLVCITTMRPYQIIAGKLGVSLLQIMIYLSVLAPCMAFTYLLRGIDIRQIWWGSTIAVAGSVTLCLLALFLASLATSRQVSVLMSVLLLMGLLFAYWMWSLFVYGLSFEYAQFGFDAAGGPTRAMLYFYFGFAATTSFILFAAASAQIAFPADNRSTWIRIATLTQQVFLFGVMATMCTIDFSHDSAFFMSMVFCHYWLAFGSMMCAVPASMSRRVRRSLPTTTLGRSLQSLFMPGPGRGFLFAASNIWAWNLATHLYFITASSLLPAASSSSNLVTRDYSLSASEVSEMTVGLVGNCVYATLFLTVTFLLMSVRIRRTTQLGPLLGLVVTALTVAIASLTPIAICIQWMRGSLSDYYLISLTNWYWTTVEIFDGRADRPLAEAALAIVAIFTCLPLFFALRLAGRELHYLPESIPNRVMEEAKRQRGELSTEPVRHPLD